MRLVTLFTSLAIALAAVACGPSGDSNSPPAGSAAEQASQAAQQAAAAAGAAAAGAAETAQQAAQGAAEAATGAAQQAAASAGAATAALTGNPQQGAALYQTYCSSCHGPRGEGDGPVAAGLNPKPAKHNDGAYMNALSNEHLFKVVKDGGPAVGKSPLMAPWGTTLNEQQIWDLVAFVRSLAKPPYQPAS